ncbi:DUF1254 domain-containing protein [Novosphingobium olei]|uniref:DUF1254 domain-containing protein n=1 Tax=Novosphingobium olei TaxID=2728851 RepID=UPI00308ACA15|nr:DUF1254 domain-containing protein [Novosphingobium olei]
MKRALILVAAFLATALAVHVITVFVAPHAIMAVAIRKLGQDGKAVNAFQFSRRTSSQSRAIVRPSPDLAYASCVYDLDSGPLLVKAAPTPGGGYASISVFAGNTDNIGVFDTISHPDGIRFVLARAGEPLPDAAVRLALPVVLSSSRQGVILDRRLAPTAETFALADKARRADSCAPLR